MKCEDCENAEATEYNRWCDECFEKGLTKDMNDHWDQFWEDELGDKKCD